MKAESKDKDFMLTYENISFEITFSFNANSCLYIFIVFR